MSLSLAGVASAQVGRVAWMEVSSPPEDGIVFIEDDEIHVLVRVNSGHPGFSHEDGPPRPAINIGANTRYATVTTPAPLRASTVCTQPRGTPNGTLSNNLCFVHTVQADDLDEDGISIGPGAPGPNGATFGDDLHADLRASDNMVLAGHAITNDRARRVDGLLTEHPPANAIGIHPGIIGVSVVASAYDDTFYPGERISVAVRHNRSVRVSGHGVPVLTLDVRGNLRTARFDQARFLTEQVFVAVGDEDVDPPRLPTVLHGGAERLWFSHAVGADDSDADGISIPSNGLGTPDSKVIVSRDRSALGDSLAGIVLSRYPGRAGRHGRPVV